jgi:hypothetical protein
MADISMKGFAGGTADPPVKVLWLPRLLKAFMAPFA